MQNRRITETQIAALWKQHLQARDYRPATINAMLIALNRFSTVCIGKTAGSKRWSSSAACSAARTET
ncbi:hypothetical protein [Agathobaculum desmolans]|uniref:hypothetical protein n=1 Tax=Agathobaculum desmolans TaxID=39484 RepID=UPI003992F399